MNTLKELDRTFEAARRDPEFLKEYQYYLRQYVGRETPLYYAERLSAACGTNIYLKREDLNHTGAHKINNVIGQLLLASALTLCKLEGIIPAIESAHAVAYAMKMAQEMTADQNMIVCLSGRGDKDVQTIAEHPCFLDEKNRKEGEDR